MTPAQADHANERARWVLEGARRPERFGFLFEGDLEALAVAEPYRLTLILVRCGGCRFTAPAQDVATIVRALKAAGDYVRDYSLPVRP